MGAEVTYVTWWWKGARSKCHKVNGMFGTGCGLAFELKRGAAALSNVPNGPKCRRVGCWG